jgi:hypothetical protein
MGEITIDEPDMAVPKARYEDLVKYVDSLNEGMTRFEINTPKFADAIAQQYYRQPERNWAEARAVMLA